MAAGNGNTTKGNVMKHDWKRTVWTLVLAWTAAVNPMQAQAETGADPSMDAEVRRTAALMMYTKWMDAFRLCGMEEPERLAVRFLQGTGLRTWEREMAPYYEPVSLADFFTAAIPLLGPFDESHCLAGLYNPHWHAILLLQTEGTVPTSDEDEIGALPRVERMYFLSGEAFCGEPDAEPEYGMVVPGGYGATARPGEPLSPGIWRACAKVVRRFDELYGPERMGKNGMRLAELGVLGLDPQADRDRLLGRVALHLKGRADMARNAQTAAMVDRMEAVLRQASVALMGRYFAEPHHVEFVKSYSALDGMFHQGMVPYGYVEGDDGRLFVFANREFPRIYATVSMPKRERIADVKKEAVQFEWFDLDRAEELLSLWETYGKAVAE